MAVVNPPSDKQCETCKGDPEVCATVPGLRHCEAANRIPALNRQLSEAHYAMADQRDKAAGTASATKGDFTHSSACAWWLDWNENLPPQDCRPCSCGVEARKALNGVARYLERDWLNAEGRVAEALRVAKIGLGEESVQPEAEGEIEKGKS